MLPPDQGHLPGELPHDGLLAAHDPVPGGPALGEPGARGPAVLPAPAPLGALPTPGASSSSSSLSSLRVYAPVRVPVKVGASVVGDAVIILPGEGAASAASVSVSWRTWASLVITCN